MKLEKESQPMTNEDLEVLREVLREGSELLSRANDRIDLLSSKALNMLSAIFAVISIALATTVFSVDRGVVKPSELWTLALVFFVPISLATVCFWIVILPKTYAEISTYREPDFDKIIESSIPEVLGHLIFAKKAALKSIEDRYEKDINVHVIGLLAFTVSVIGLAAFYINQISSM